MSLKKFFLLYADNFAPKIYKTKTAVDKNLK